MIATPQEALIGRFAAGAEDSYLYQTVNSRPFDMSLNHTPIPIGPGEFDAKLLCDAVWNDAKNAQDTLMWLIMSPYLLLLLSHMIRKPLMRWIDAHAQISSASDTQTMLTDEEFRATHPVLSYIKRKYAFWQDELITWGCAFSLIKIAHILYFNL